MNLKVRFYGQIERALPRDRFSLISKYRSIDTDHNVQNFLLYVRIGH